MQERDSREQLRRLAGRYQRHGLHPVGEEEDLVLPHLGQIVARLAQEAPMEFDIGIRGSRPGALRRRLFGGWLLAFERRRILASDLEHREVNRGQSFVEQGRFLLPSGVIGDFDRLTVNAIITAPEGRLVGIDEWHAVDVSSDVAAELAAFVLRNALLDE